MCFECLCNALDCLLRQSFIPSSCRVCLCQHGDQKKVSQLVLMCLSSECLSEFSSSADCQCRFWTQRFLYILLQMRGYAIVDFLPILQLGIAPVVLDSDSCNFRVYLWRHMTISSQLLHKTFQLGLSLLKSSQFYRIERRLVSRSRRFLGFLRACPWCWSQRWDPGTS
jgi:hypothetical protein